MTRPRPQEAPVHSAITASPMAKGAVMRSAANKQGKASQKLRWRIFCQVVAWYKRIRSRNGRSALCGPTSALTNVGKKVSRQ